MAHSQVSDDRLPQFLTTGTSIGVLGSPHNIAASFPTGSDPREGKHEATVLFMVSYTITVLFSVCSISQCHYCGIELPKVVNTR